MKYFNNYKIDPLSLMLSLIAIFISYQTYLNGVKANDISMKNNLDETSLVLQASFTRNNNNFMLSPLRKNFKLQEIILFYPTKLLNQHHLIDNPTFEVRPYKIINKLEKSEELNYLKKYKIAWSSPDEFVEKKIPILIKSTYIVKGNKYIDQSLYYLHYFVFIQSDEKELHSNATITRLLFEKRFSNENNPITIINNKWNQHN